jgi:hypothetical protein
VEAVLAATAEMPSPLIGLEENKITRKPLLKAVEVVSVQSYVQCCLFCTFLANIR